MNYQSHRMVYISRCYHNLTSAGNKAKTDNETTMQEMGFVNIGLPQRVKDKGIFIFLYNLAGIIKACCLMRHDDILVLQYPVKKYFTFLCRAAHLHDAKVVAIIHDLGSFRRQKLTVRKEIERLSHADSIIASNQAMEQWLKDNGLKKATSALGLFDYRSTAAIEEKTHDYNAGNPQSSHKAQSYRVVYAGSLNPRKNSFFLSLPSVIHGFEPHIYGKGDAMPSLKNDPRIVFHDFTPADEFIAHCDGDFGLVWDGDSLDSCAGPFGEYLRYNSPHKASFYLRAGLPVIVWKDAGIAPIIEREGIGITISSLRELPQRLAEISDEELRAMRQRVLKTAGQLNNGYFFRNAIEKACNHSSLALAE